MKDCSSCYYSMIGSCLIGDINKRDEFNDRYELDCYVSIEDKLLCDLMCPVWEEEENED